MNQYLRRQLKLERGSPLRRVRREPYLTFTVCLDKYSES